MGRTVLDFLGRLLFAFLTACIMYALASISQVVLLCYLCMGEREAVMMRNNIKQLVDKQKISRYKFWKQTGLNRETAYRLYDDPTYIPGAEVMEKIAIAYGWQPGMYVFYIPKQLLS